MAAAEAAPHFGAELKVSNGIAWMEEVQQFYRERSAIEKEYAAKLTALCKKYYDRKAKKISPLSVGDNPTMTPGSLESASLTTWSTQLAAVEAHAAERDKFATDLVAQVAEPLKQSAVQYEELRKCHVDFHGKLEKERESSFSDLKKAKGKYDGACQEVESRRKKMESAFDHGKTKAQTVYQQQIMEMNNVKLKEKFFHEYVPELLDEPANVGFEPSPVWHDDEALITDETAKVFLRNLLSKSKTQVRELRVESDQKRREVENAKRVRQSIQEGRDNRNEVDVVRSIFFMQESLHEIERKRLTAEVETSTIISVVGDLSLGAKNHNFKSQTFKIPTNCDLCGERIWGLSAKGYDCRDCGYTCHSKCEMKVPAECPGEQTKEEKKRLKAERQEQASAAPAVDLAPTSASSTAPSLSRRDTMNSLSSGYAVSANRSVSNVGTHESVAEAPESIPTSTAPAAPTATKPAVKRNRILAPPPAQYISSPPSAEAPTSNSSQKEPRGKMLYPYQATGADEVTVQEGEEIFVLEPDDGSGWMRVRSESSAEGLVPASYVEVLAAPASSSSPAGRPGSTYSSSSASLAGSTAAAAGKKVGPAVAPRRGAKKLQYVEALYDYEARSDMEWSMVEGDRFVLVNRDSGDGWADVERGGVTKSVPANYIQEV
ncbi:hypothetical protein AN7658.2 [Aspergillus nidulans FGSC A4]|nr:hypothetical protein AN7658.2 [Aspergillus nidulans FGSC A4]|eukprot:XP_680927.1 hypothetical protein AN7658.2 [Aspergillus nidulans FGSC A4]